MLRKRSPSPKRRSQLLLPRPRPDINWRIALDCVRAEADTWQTYRMFIDLPAPIGGIVLRYIPDRHPPPAPPRDAYKSTDWWFCNDPRFGRLPAWARPATAGWAYRAHMSGLAWFRAINAVSMAVDQGGARSGQCSHRMFISLKPAAPRMRRTPHPRRDRRARYRRRRP